MSLEVPPVVRKRKSGERMDEENMKKARGLRRSRQQRVKDLDSRAKPTNQHQTGCSEKSP
jgi:hypothetical protein